MKTITSRPAEKLMSENMLVKHFAGSISYGTNIATSDVDYRGVFAADPINILTPFFPIREAEDANEEDTKLYELTHFMKLCLDCNPNVIETLWVDESDIVATSPAYKLLREHRSELLSSKIAYTTSGYAMSQLKRIKGHNKWINDPQPDVKPQQQEYVSLVQWFGSDKVLARDFDISNYNFGYHLIHYGGGLYGLHQHPDREAIRPADGSLNSNYDGEREDLSPVLALLRFNKDLFSTDCDKWENYWRWKNNRNVTRSALEEEHGYDTKHAMHLFRLLRMGVETLTDGVVVVKRPDAEELLSIRNGALTYDELLSEATKLEDEIKTLHKTTALRKKPDVKFAANLLMAVQEQVWT